MDNMSKMTDEDLQAVARGVVAELLELSPEQCSKLAAVLDCVARERVKVPESRPKAADLLSREEVAARIGVTKQWLIRNASDGPAYHKLAGGTVRYGEDDLKSWLKQRKVNS